ncbi:MAG TPA: SAM-dependent methyltransferase [Hyphomonadaceae bacterium]|nr:SAM-dependent methyltransferase [Hyphomonadaceae bacterium]
MDQRSFSPSTARNREPILNVLQRVLAAKAKVLELASGAGEHAAFFARAMPGWSWRPSDPDAGTRASIAAWIEIESLSNVLAPAAIDVCADAWGVEDEAPYDALVCINMIHISPWEATLGLMAGAARLLRAGGVLYTYGAYKSGGAHTAPSNETFDAWLKQRDARFGVRGVEDVERAAQARGLRLHEIVEMPANNLSLVFLRN